MFIQTGIKTEKDFIEHILPKTLQNDKDVLALTDFNVYSFIFDYNNFTDPRECLFSACEGNHIHLAEFILEKCIWSGMYLEDAISHAIIKGQFDIVKHFIENGMLDNDLNKSLLNDYYITSRIHKNVKVTKFLENVSKL